MRLKPSTVSKIRKAASLSGLKQSWIIEKGADVLATALVRIARKQMTEKEIEEAIRIASIPWIKG